MVITNMYDNIESCIWPKGSCAASILIKNLKASLPELYRLLQQIGTANYVRVCGKKLKKQRTCIM